jgi:hypothetical protein
MPINTSFNPKTISEFTKDHLEFSGQALAFECLASATQTQDLMLSEDYLITGGSLIVEGGNIEDMIYLQVIHPVAGVLKEFITGYRIASDVSKQIELELKYPAKIVAGLGLRCKYVAGTTVSTRKIAVNFYLHRVLE